MKVFTIGETVLDIIFKDNQPVSAKAGGSVLNSSVSLGRLGVDVNFISDYGSDQVGDFIDEFLNENHVNTDHVVRFKQHKSALALAFLDQNNDANYSFYKDFPLKRLQNLSIQFSKEDYLLFGSFFAITESVRESLLNILNDARRAGVTIIYDPNFRRPHLNELERVKPWIIENIGFADLVKGSDEDFQLIFGAENAEEAFTSINKAGCNNLIYTSGPREVFVKTSSISINLPVPVIKTVSTIGAGDNFNAGIVWSLYHEDIHRNTIQNLSEEKWKMIANYGISFATEVCQNYENYITSGFASSLIKTRSSPYK